MTDDPTDEPLPPGQRRKVGRQEPTLRPTRPSIDRGELVLELGPAVPENVQQRLNAYAFRDPSKDLDWTFLRLNPKTGQLIHPTRKYDVCGAVTKVLNPQGMWWGAALPICMNPAGQSNELGRYGRCDEHLGLRYNSRLKSLEKLGIREARRVLKSMGEPVDVNPVEALLYLVQEAAGNVAFLGARVQDLGYNLVGPVYSLTREGDAVQTSEDILAMVKLYNDERDRLARVSKIALDAGIEERTVRIIEEQATTLVHVIRSVVDNLGLSSDVRQRALALVSQELRRLDHLETSSTIEGLAVDVSPVEAVDRSTTKPPRATPR